VIEGEVDADVDADAAAEPGDAVDGDAPAGEDAAE
jgi:hypothetical protein